MRSVLTFLSGVVGWVIGSGVVATLPGKAGTVVQAVGAVLTVLGIRDATSNPSAAVADWLAHLGSGWKTAVGLVVWALGVLLSPDVFATLPPAVAYVVQVVGQVLAALGLYHAANKPAALRLAGGGAR